MAELESRSPTTGELLGAVEAAGPEAVRAAVAAAAAVQPLWAAVPVAARARYLRRAAQAVLDDLDRLAVLIARETGRPRSEALLAELLPSVSGLHALADDGPRVLADERLGRPRLRRATLIQAPLGAVGIRGRDASPWVELVLEVAASLLAGNAALFAPPAPLVGERIVAAFLRAGVPGELVAAVHGRPAFESPPPDASPLPDDPSKSEAGLARVVDLRGEEDKATMLVLGDAPLGATVAGALWAAFAGAGRHSAAAGRLFVAPEAAGALLERLVDGAQRLRVGDPEHADTEVGPLASHADLEALERIVAEAEAAGAARLCGGPMTLAGLAGAFCAPVVLRGDTPSAPGPVLAIVEAESEDHAIALASAYAAAPVSVWTADHRRGERVARALGAELAWVNEHGQALPSVPVRLARHTSPRRLAFQPPHLRSTRWLPYDPALVRVRTAVARVLHGRESQRVSALREGALPAALLTLRSLRRR
jgi:acyl-CoA reductase-like NAD-dependent aldehyde dehydrogenase